MVFKLFVGNVPQDLTETELRKEFSEYGEISGAWVNKGADYAFVQYDKREDAEDAMECVNEKMVWNKKLRVQMSHQRTPIRPKSEGGYQGEKPPHARPPPGNYFRGGGFRGAPRPRGYGGPPRGGGYGRNDDHYGGRSSPSFRHRSRSPRYDRRSPPHRGGGSKDVIADALSRVSGDNPDALTAVATTLLALAAKKGGSNRDDDYGRVGRSSRRGYDPY